MPLRTLRVHQSPHLLPLSSALTDIINSYDFAADRDMLVHCFDPMDTPNWRRLPTVWHLNDSTTIVLNMGKIYAAIFSSYPTDEVMGEVLRNYSDTSKAFLTWRKLPDGTRVPMPSKRLDIEFPEYLLGQTNPANERPHLYKTRSGKLINPRPLDKTHVAAAGRIEVGWHYTGNSSYYGLGIEALMYNLVLGTIMREAAYSVFNQPVVDSDWYREATGYQKNIIAVLEELRVEYQQMKRINGDPMKTARRFFRSALAITGNTRAIIEDMTRRMADGKGMTAANIGLNSSLILGRTHVGTLLQFEVAKIRSLVEDYIDSAAMTGMDEIWAEYIQITDADYDNVMPLVERWQDLFPSKADGSNAGSNIAPGAPGAGGSGTGGTPAEGSGDGSQPASGDGTEGEGESEGEGDGSGKGGEQEGEAPGLNDQADFTGEQLDKNQADPNKEMTPSQAPREKGGVATAFGNNATPLEDPDANDPGKDDNLDLDSESAANEFENSFDETSSLFDAEYEEHEYGPNDLTPSRISYSKAKHRRPAGDTADAIERGREIEPSGTDHNLANHLSKALENLNIYDVGKFKVREIAPPGRMKSRAAVQQSAERALNLPQVARPWSRTKRTVDINPPLTIGVMTDVSSSQGWAEKISAELSWILSSAVSKIGGRVACVSFGMGVTITQRPGELARNAQVVRADNGGELFDMGAGTIDYMLNLVNGTGTRMLFVLTDGRFGVDNELQKAAQWVKTLTERGVYVVWVTPDPTCKDPVETRATGWDESGLPITPEGVIPIAAERLRRPGSGSSRHAETVKVINEIASEVTKAVRATKMQAHR